MAPLTRVLPTAAARASSLLRTIQFSHPPSCPCHSNPGHHHHRNPASSLFQQQSFDVNRRYATPADGPLSKEYAFELAASSIRFGPGVTQEVGKDLKNLKAKKVCVVTDPTVAQLFPMQQTIESLEREGINYKVYDGVRIEPKDTSIHDSIKWAITNCPDADAFLAVGGGSVMDTAKLMNLYRTYEGVPFLDFVNAPIGKGRPVDRPLKPLICVPTTAGTGSETTGTAIFDLTSHNAKTGVAHRNLKPLLGICDPLNMRTMPSAVKASSGLDVLCHSLESYTAIPYNERTPRPADPIQRPAYQGANPISDVFSMHALRQTVKYLPRAVKNPDDLEAQSEMLLAATLAGVGFGNAGVHLCHGMSYPISGLNHARYRHEGYQVKDPLIPHGVSVAVTAPTVFRFTAASNPERHLAAAEAFGVDISQTPKESAGEVLSEALSKFLDELGGQPKGLKGLGFEKFNAEMLAEGTIPQRRVVSLAPGMEGGERDRDVLIKLFEDAMER